MSSEFIIFYENIPRENPQGMRNFISDMPCHVLFIQKNFTLKTKIYQEIQNDMQNLQNDMQNLNLSNDLSTISQNNKGLQLDIQQLDKELKSLANHYPPNSCDTPPPSKTPPPSSENESNHSIKTENKPYFKNIYSILYPLTKEIDELLTNNINTVGNLTSALVTLNKNHESNILNTLRELREYFESLRDLNKSFPGLIETYEDSYSKFMNEQYYNKEEYLNTMQNSLNTMQNNLNNLITDYKKMNKTQILNLKNELLNKYNKIDIINKIEALNIIITTNNNKLNAELEKFINLLATSDAE
ncbi:MAG: hypothetical protein DCC88_10420 [Spirobacillus cienkowskii]|jgi:hypothetical protein|uniref:Uncharacterized protein n=1 Tax=Spirobacillus cienkowskii TaxID=495820 RepID=A0A369KLA2_9BACT|nr:MAG: hypothetical protein DCC88_10420 [Spirobacillus cienkowskii]